MEKGSEKRHEHRGRSSKGLLDPKGILKDIGLRRGDALLDAGCGEGHFSIAASKLVREGRVYAVDSDEEAIAILKKELSEKEIINIAAIVADLSKNIPISDERIDVTLMVNVLHGLVANDEADGAMKEISRVTKHGGRLSLVDFKKIPTPMGPPLSIKLSPEEAEALMSRYGFKKDRVVKAGQYHYHIMMIRE